TPGTPLSVISIMLLETLLPYLSSEMFSEDLREML
ncbi:unnamed protein product, partial [Tuber aestivum]